MRFLTNFHTVYGCLVSIYNRDINLHIVKTDYWPVLSFGPGFIGFSPGKTSPGLSALPCKKAAKRWRSSPTAQAGSSLPATCPAPRSIEDPTWRVEIAES